jgi:hypothetical protein
MLKFKTSASLIFDLFILLGLSFNVTILILVNSLDSYNKWFIETLNIESPTKIFLIFTFSFLILKFNRKYKNKIKLHNLLKSHLSYRHFFVFLVIFIIIKIFFIVGSPINVSDDWQAIISGKNLIENGSFTHITLSDSSIGYTRGMYVSLTTALFFKLFGQTMFVAKAVPAFIGTICFILFYLVSRKIFETRQTQVLAIVIYTLSPLVIFSHWFVRMYVFYELFLLATIWLLFKINTSLKEKNKNSTAIYTLFLLILNFINWTLSFDTGKYLIAIATILGVIILTYLNREIILEHRYIKNILVNRIIGTYHLLLITMIIVTALTINFIPVVQDRIVFLISGKLDNASHMSIYTFFFIKNLSLAIFFAVSCFMISRMRNDNTKIITIIGSILFLLHLISSQDLQIIRSVIYFFPIFILVSLISLEIFIQKYKSKFVGFIIIALLFTNLFYSYPSGFITTHPYLENELHYQDDVGLYSFIKGDLKDYIIIQSTYENMPDIFFESKTLFNVILNGHSTTNIPYFYFDNNSKNYRQISTNVPVISDKEMFYNKLTELSKVKTAIVILPHVRESFLDEDSYNFIKETLPNKKEFIGYVVYYN